MPKKTREQKIKAAERRSQQTPSLSSSVVFSEKKPISEQIKSEAISNQHDQYEQTESEKRRTSSSSSYFFYRCTIDGNQRWFEKIIYLKFKIMNPVQYL